MADQNTLDRMRALFRKTNEEQEYEPIDDDIEEGDFDEVRRPILVVPDDPVGPEPFSWWIYFVFLLLGIAMLWAWNMFLAAAPYFQSRFADNKQILNSFQPAITSVSTVTTLLAMIVLGKIQANANYPKRILSSLIINVIVFTLLAISTSWFRGVSSPGYLAFTLVMVFTTSCATALCQNGAFAFSAGFGHPEYTNAIMTGQAVAGVLPSAAQIVVVLALPAPNAWATAAEQVAFAKQQNTASAFIYFITATAVSLVCLFSVMPLIRKHIRALKAMQDEAVDDYDESEPHKRKIVGMWTLYKKLHWLAFAVFLCFVVTMFFPVFTQKIVSLTPEDKAAPILKSSAFIPLGFFVWNVGDFFGRLLCLAPFSMRHHPIVLFTIAILRGGFIPLYLLCNIENKGAIINSDAFYLVIVQLGFGLTNGWLSSSCMMQSNDYVEDDEREAAGGFMAINLVGGLMVGSLLSFTASNAS